MARRPTPHAWRIAPPAMAAMLLLTGCARVPREAGFEHVSQSIAERTGQEVHWNQGTEADAAVAARVEAMLRDAPLTADQSVQIALLNNRHLQATYEDLMVAQADLVDAGLLSNPVLEAEVRFLEGGGGETIEVGIVQEFLSIFQIPLRKKIAAARFEAAQMRVAGAVLETARQVRVAYYRLVASRQLLELRQTITEATGAAYELAQRLHEAGNTTDLALHMERAAYESSKLDLAAAEFDVISSRAALGRLMGVWGETVESWQVPEHLADLPPEPESVDAVEARIVEANFELAAMRREMESAGRVLGLERTAGLFPEAEAGVIGEREADGQWAIGPVLELPLPLFNQGQPQVATAMASLRRARARYYATAVELRAAARTAMARVDHARRRVTYYQQVLMPLRELVTQETQLQYNAMQIGGFELFEARREQVETAVETVEALRDYWEAQSALDTLRAGGAAGASRTD